MIQLKVYDSPAKTSQFWMDLYETEPIKLTLSIEDITSADATSTYSKTFKVPGTRKNAEFFKNSFDVDGTLFDVTIKKPAEILVDGAEFKQGQVRLQRVYLNIDLDRYDYELIFLGETRDFSSKIGDRGLCELQLPDLIGGIRNPAQPTIPTPMSVDAVQESWDAYPQFTNLTTGLHGGNIIYPLIDHGNTYDDDGDAEQTKIGIATGGGGQAGHNYFTDSNHPITIDRLKPMIRAKRIWDQIFEDAGYTYTSDFITSDLFHQIYVSAFGNEATIGWDSGASSPTSNNVAFAASDPNEYYNIGPVLLPSSTVDPGSNLFDASFVLPSSSYNGQAFTYYEIPTATGDYQIQAECFYTGQEDNSDYVPIPIFLELYLYKQTGTATPVLLTASAPGYNTTLQLTHTLQSGDYALDDKLFIVLGDISGEYIDQLYTTDFQFQIVAAPGEFNPVSSLECTYKQIDFVKDILTAFRLVLSPDPNNVQNFIIEPWQNYINSGELYDWSKKLVEDKEIVIEPVFYNQSAEIDFKFQLGGDYANIYHQQAYSEPYGYLQFDANNDLLIGKREIKLNGIAPTIITNIEGSTPANNFNIAQLHTHSTENTGNSSTLEHLPIKPKTRLLFYNGLQPASSNWYLDGASPEQQTEYPLVSPYQEWPIQPQTLNLNWANDVQYWGTATGLNQNGSTLFSNYWSRYISFLYGKFSRRVTAYFVLNNIDLNTFSFDDTIFVNGTYYRPEKIIDVEVGAYTQVKVQLLTSNDYKPAIIPFQELLEVSAVGVASPCYQQAGSINVTTNGTPGFTWQLSNGQSGAALSGAAPGFAPYTFTINNVNTGTYTLYLEDSLGRTKELPVTIPASLATPVIANPVVTPASDCNVCDGVISITPSGGTSPYGIEWYPAPGSPGYPGPLIFDNTIEFNFTSLCVGQYTYTVTDSLGCAYQSYVAEVTCESAPGDVWQFYKSSQDCQQIFNETKNVFYPTGMQPIINHYYDLSTLGGGSIKGCWTPTNITTDPANALEVAEYITCQACNGTVPSGDNYQMVQCITGTFKVVPAIPGIAIGQVYELVGLKGCYVVDSISENASDATILTGPYGSCLECGAPPTPTPTPTPVPTPTPTPIDVCVSNYGASMVPCIGGTLDDYMEGWVDLSAPTPTDATFRLVVGWLEGPNGNCSNVQLTQDLYVDIEAGESSGLLTCNNGAPFISSSGATICSVQLVESPYPECSAPEICNEYTIGGFDIGETIYLDCDGIEQTASYNGPAASGFDAETFCATEIVEVVSGSQPVDNGLCPY